MQCRTCKAKVSRYLTRTAKGQAPERQGECQSHGPEGPEAAAAASALNCRWAQPACVPRFGSAVALFDI